MRKNSLYFISDGGQSIKIGISSDVTARIRIISGAHGKELELIGSIPGTFKDEHAIHHLLDAHRLNGEWFTDCAEVRAVVNRVLSEGVAWLPRKEYARIVGCKERRAAVVQDDAPSGSIDEFLRDVRDDRLGRAQLRLATASAILAETEDEYRRVLGKEPPSTEELLARHGNLET